MIKSRVGKICRAKKFLSVLLAALLLCSCQADDISDSSGDGMSAFVQNESSESIPSDSASSEQRPESVSGTAESSGTQSSASQVCDVPFTQTDSFPMPFEGELIWDEDRLVDTNKGIIFPVEQALYDYDTMWLLLEENAPYLNAIQTDLGIDWQGVKETYRRQMARQAVNGYVTQRNFMTTIQYCLGEFRSVGHMLVISPGEYSHYLESYSSAYRSGAGEVFGNLADLTDNPKSRAFYSGAALFDQTVSNTQNKPITMDDPRAISDNIMTGFAGDSIPYLRIISCALPLDTTEENRLYQKLSQYFVSLADEEHLIIDVRGNAGGSNALWVRGIVPFLEQTSLQQDIFMGMKSGQLNMAINPSIATSSIRYTDESWRIDFPYISPQALEGTDIFLKGYRTIPKDISQSYFNGKIWVLVDGGCYSATEAFVSFCKDTGFATVIGSTTGGCGRGGQPFQMALPYSGLLVRYSPYLTFNTDGTCNDTTGTKPDIPCYKGMDALETCLQVIQEYPAN